MSSRQGLVGHKRRLGHKGFVLCSRLPQNSGACSDLDRSTASKWCTGPQRGAGGYSYTVLCPPVHAAAEAREVWSARERRA